MSLELDFLREQSSLQENIIKVLWILVSDFGLLNN